jgi:hypothetical protein
MSTLKREILDFIETISAEELSSNENLNKKVVILKEVLLKSFPLNVSVKPEILKYLSKDKL